MRTRWTTPASRALERIVDYIAGENPQAAFKVAARILSAVGQLSDFPRLGRRGRVNETFELVVAGLPFIVPYRISANEIHILSVYHTSRRWPADFDDTTEGPG